MNQAELYDKLREADYVWQQNPTEENFDRLEEIEEKFEVAFEYQTANEHEPHLQTEYLKAMDYEDAICDGLRRFFVCKAGRPRCGYAFPAKLWFQRGRKASPLNRAQRLMPGNWQYVCLVMWEYLHEESVDKPGSAADKWFKDLQNEYGEETSSFSPHWMWAQFRPLREGALHGL